MTPEELGAFTAKVIMPAVIGLWLGNSIRKDYAIKKQAKKEGISYKEMKEGLKNKEEKVKAEKSKLSYDEMMDRSIDYLKKERLRYISVLIFGGVLSIFFLFIGIIICIYGLYSIAKTNKKIKGLRLEGDEIE